MAKTQVKKVLCKMCQYHCGVDVYVKDGKVTGYGSMKEHFLGSVPKSCIKIRGMIDWLYSKERITKPLRRTNGGWRKISWDDALSSIAERLGNIKEKYGAKALVVHLGTPFTGGQNELVARRFCDVYGTPNWTTGNSYCFNAVVMGDRLTLGIPASAYPDFEATQCIVVWGENPNESRYTIVDHIAAAKEKGARLIVIDPRVTPLAKGADIHAQIRPGTDCALALGLINVIIAEGLYDRAFVEKWTVGFDSLEEHVKQYTPEKVEQITWVPAVTIKNIARLYASSKPAVIRRGISIDHCTNGIQAHRAIASLIAITENVGIKGGNVYLVLPKYKDVRMKGKIQADETIGAEHPVFTEINDQSSVLPFADAAIEGKPYPVKALMVQGSNLALTWANTQKVIEALKKLDLFVVIDLFLTDSAKLADFVLPATSFLERKELRHYLSWPMPVISRSDKAIEPLQECMEDWKIWAELANKMGYGEYFPWNDTDDLLEYLLEPTGITVDQLRENPGGIAYAEWDERKYLEEGFPTPSKKVELYSETLERHGYDPLPTFHEPLESVISMPDVAKEYPLILITGVRVNEYTHSRYRNIPSMRKLRPEPCIEINPRTANALDISDNEMVTVESLRGQIRLKARVTEDIHPNVVTIQQGWKEANANILTDDEVRDPISGYPGFKSILCRVAADKK